MTAYGGRVILESGATLTTDQTALFDNAPLNQPSSGSLFVFDSTFNAGTMTPVTDANLYLGIDGGTFNTDGVSLTGGVGGSEIVLGMKNGAQFICNGNFTFTGSGNIATTSFTLGPIVVDPTADADVASP